MRINDQWVPETFRIFLADWRTRLVDPCGGRVKLGLINQGDSPPVSSAAPPAPTTTTITQTTLAPPGGGSGSTGGAGAPGPSPTSQPPLEMSITELIGACLEAMGMPDADVPDDLDSVPATRGLQWFGSHAPTELEKLLTLAGCEVAPDLKGSGSVVEIDTGPSPDFGDDALPIISIPKSDARGTTVVVASYPSRNISTQNLSAPSTSTFYFVAQEYDGGLHDGDWYAMDHVSYFNGSAANCWKSKFQNVDANHRTVAAAQAFRYLQLADSVESKLPPASMSPILTKRIESGSLELGISVKAKIAQLDPKTGLYTNSTDYVTVAADFLLNKMILRLAQPLFQVTQPTSDIYTNFQAVGSGDVMIRISTEDAAKDDQGAWQPTYFEAGFQRDGKGNLKPLTEDETQVARNCAE